MAFFTSINSNGYYFEEQLARGNEFFDPCAVLGLFSDDVLLTQHGARFYFKQVVKHRNLAGYNVDSSFQRGHDSFYGNSMFHRNPGTFHILLRCYGGC